MEKMLYSRILGGNMVRLNNRKLKVILENTEQVINDLEFDLE
ncbi:hypothetical protein [Clostridium tetani]|nr:hypothetical protein [Clostridium tetani]